MTLPLPPKSKHGVRPSALPEATVYVLRSSQMGALPICIGPVSESDSIPAPFVSLAFVTNGSGWFSFPFWCDAGPHLASIAGQNDIVSLCKLHQFAIFAALIFHVDTKEWFLAGF